MGVPDQDVIPRGVRGSWRTPFRALAEQRSADEVSRLLTPAIVETVRREGGMPWVATLAGGLQRSIQDGDRGAWEAAQGQALSAAPASPSLRLAVEAGEGMFANPGLPGDSETTLVERTLQRMTQARLFAPARGELVSRMGDHSAEQAYEEAVLRVVPLHEIAERVRRHPDGQGLRAPSSGSRRSIAELLDEPIEEPT